MNSCIFRMIRVNCKMDNGDFSMEIFSMAMEIFSGAAVLKRTSNPPRRWSRWVVPFATSPSPVFFHIGSDPKRPC